MARRPPKRSFAVRYAPLLLALVAILVFVGLRTDDDLGVGLPGRSEEEAPEGAGRSTSTTAEDGPAATLPTSTVNPQLDDPADVPESLREAQLTLADLPSEWGEAGLSGDSTEICPGHDPARSVDPESALKASFSAGDEGPYLTSLVAEFGDDDEADAYHDALEGALEDCDGFEDDLGLTYEVDRTQGADLGDRSVTASLRVTSPSSELQGRILSVRVGDRIVTIAFSATGDADAAIAVDALDTVLARLDD